MRRTPLTPLIAALAAAAPAAPLLGAVAVGGVASLAISGCENEEPKTALSYTEDAKRAYDAAMEQYNAHNWIEAQTALREVKRKYSYSKYARMAELRLADSDYEQEKFSDAIREYKDFIHAHRSDTEDVAYARSRIADSTFKEIPDSALIGAVEERDQASVVDAYKELTSYLADFPDAKETPHVRDLLVQVIARLVRHELYVARFYLGRNNYEAAVARIQYALHNYGPGGAQVRAGIAADSDLDAEALLLLGQTYLQMHKWPEARSAFQTIVQAHGTSPIVVQARDYLQHLDQQGV
ncbi:MAG TPA: outer membrane protein assembly factor BamD [Polyangiaceae bacterium]|jgi:outer membrane protein assembly factor BamD|nr:outer membrane protein assembly factor BamD [Polyangiaceae bacterium]